MESIQVTVLPVEVLDNDCGVGAAISESLFERLFGSHDGIFGLNLYTDEQRIAITCMPVADVESDAIYVPLWASQALMAPEVFIEPVEIDLLLRARTLKVRILDDELDHGLVRDELEKYLYDFKFLQPNIVLNLELEEAAYSVQILIESIIDEDGIECDGPALLGSEVELDICGQASEEEPIVAQPESSSEAFAHVSASNDEVVPPSHIPGEDEKKAMREARLRRFANP